MGCWNSNLALFGVFWCWRWQQQGFPCWPVRYPISSPSACAKCIWHVIDGNRKSNPLCRCWSLSHWLSACSGIDRLWFMISKIFIGSIYSGTRACPSPVLIGVSPSAGTAPGLETAAGKGQGCSAGSCMESNGRLEKAPAEDSFAQGRQLKAPKVTSPAQCPHLLPSLSQAIPRLAFSSLASDFTQEFRPSSGASCSHGIASLKWPLLERPRGHWEATSSFSQFCCASVKWTFTGQNEKIL